MVAHRSEHCNEHFGKWEGQARGPIDWFFSHISVVATGAACHAENISEALSNLTETRHWTTGMACREPKFEVSCIRKVVCKDL